MKEILKNPDRHTCGCRFAVSESQPTTTQALDLCRRWGVIMAGGDGKRLLSLTRKLTGDDRPKQFCALTGIKTLLDHIRQRVVPCEGFLFLGAKGFPYE